MHDVFACRCCTAADLPQMSGGQWHGGAPSCRPWTARYSISAGCQTGTTRTFRGGGKSAVATSNHAWHNVNTATTPIYSTYSTSGPSAWLQACQVRTEYAMRCCMHVRASTCALSTEYSRESPPAFCAAGRIAPPMIVRLLRDRRRGGRQVEAGMQVGGYEAGRYLRC